MTNPTIASSRFSLKGVANALEERPPGLAVDLVSVAAQLYAADRSFKRGRSWKRHLRVPIAVSETSFWSRGREALESALANLTDDSWELEFEAGRQPLPEERQPWLLKSKDCSLTCVALFSGGLDSFAGAASWLEEHETDILGLVSISSSTVIGRVQRDLFDLLSRNFPERVQHFRVPLKLIEAPDIERSQRTRGLLYTAIATAIANCAGVEQVLIFENGYGAINPRLLEYQLGAQATKSTHPFVVSALEIAYRDAGLSCRVGLPNLDKTKAELLRRIPERLRQGISLSVSCDGFPLRLKATKQCGHCGSCVLRQEAVIEAGLESFDRCDYLASPFKGGERLRHIRLMASQAKSLAALTDSDLARIGKRWPEIVLGLDGQASLDRVEWLQMLHRYGLEWRRIVAGNSALAARLGWEGQR